MQNTVKRGFVALQLFSSFRMRVLLKIHCLLQFCIRILRAIAFLFFLRAPAACLKTWWTVISHFHDITTTECFCLKVVFYYSWELSCGHIPGCFLLTTSRNKKAQPLCVFDTKKCVCKSLYFLIRKMANSLNFISALLLEAQSTPFQITPSTMANIVKGLYTLRPGKREKYF